MDCWDQAIHAFGTAAIFGKRARKMASRLRFLSFLAIALPAAIGAVVASLGVKFRYLDFVILVAGLTGIAQLVAAIWSLTANWADVLAYSRESQAGNQRLAVAFQDLATGTFGAEEFKIRSAVLRAEVAGRDEQDLKQDVTEKEKRYGMRAALRQYQRPCIGCKEVPRSLDPSKCDICGRF